MFKFKIEKGKVWKSEYESIRTSAGDCAFCNKPVFVAEGQLTKHLNDKPTHKSCRKNNKELNN